MDTTLEGALIGVGGVLLGVVAASAFNLWQVRAHDRQVERGVRLLLRLECGENLAALDEFWKRVTNPQYRAVYGVGVGLTFDDENFHNLLQLAEVPLPAWGHLMWESQAGLIASALRPDMALRAYKLYADLDLFASIRQRLQDTMSTPDAKTLVAAFYKWMEDRRLRNQAPEANLEMYKAVNSFTVTHGGYWNECLAIYNRVTATRDSTGLPMNPIPVEAPIQHFVNRAKYWIHLDRRVNQQGLGN